MSVGVYVCGAHFFRLAIKSILTKSMLSHRFWICYWFFLNMSLRRDIFSQSPKSWLFWPYLKRPESFNLGSCKWKPFYSLSDCSILMLFTLLQKWDFQYNFIVPFSTLCYVTLKSLWRLFDGIFRFHILYYISFCKHFLHSVQNV